MIHERGRQRNGQTDRQRTETATIRVLSDLLDAVDRGDTAALVLLDLTAAINTVDHEILLERLRVTFGEQSLFQSYLGFSLISLDARSTFVVAASRHVFYSYRHHLWCATRIGPRTDPFHYLYR